MLKFGKWIVKCRIYIIAISFLLLIPSLFGMINTRINYDMLSYLPENMETVKGQDILLNDFGKGAFSIVIVDGMEPHQVAKVKEDIENVNHVDSVIWYDSVMDLSIPMDMLPEKIYNAFNNENSTLMAVFFNTSTSADETISAIEEIRAITGKDCFVTGMSALVTDLKKLCETEEPIYVALAVLSSIMIMMIFMDSFLVPFIFIMGIGMAIIWNLGSNVFLGEISFITKALSAILQLGVTMDYSIFLWHSYVEEKNKFPDNKKTAMAHAVANTLSSVMGSSITTVAGFLALCFMSFTLGKDLGLVMAKGVVLGVVGCVTTLPALILLLDKPLEKTMHKPIMPNINKLSEYIIKAAPVFIIAFIIVSIPAFYGYQNTNVYYNLSETMPDDMEFKVANNKLQDDFNMGSTHMILVDSKLSQNKVKSMMDEIDKLDGVKTTLGIPTAVGPQIPQEFIPDTITDKLRSSKYELLLVNTEYKTASPEINNQITLINSIIKDYDSNAMLIGEAPCTKDMIDVTDYDFKVVNLLSILAIFIIIAIVFKSISLPFILVAVIEFAIFINLGLPYYTDTTLSFVAPICVSTIQLGATVDYAILMTTRYKRARAAGIGKKHAVTEALSISIPSITVGALCFFAATFGVGMYSDVEMISSMCYLMSRGAIISMLSVILCLPAMLMLFDKLIINTSMGFKTENKITAE